MGHKQASQTTSSGHQLPLETSSPQMDLQSPHGYAAWAYLVRAMDEVKLVLECYIRLDRPHIFGHSAPSPYPGPATTGNFWECLHPYYAWMVATQLLHNGVEQLGKDGNSDLPQQNLSLHCHYLLTISEWLQIITCVGWPSQPDELGAFY